MAKPPNSRFALIMRIRQMSARIRIVRTRRTPPNWRATPESVSTASSRS